MILHTKKILPEYYEQVIKGNKRFEVRKEDDCNYNVGDIVVLCEWGTYSGIPIGPARFTGRALMVKVKFVLRGCDGLAPGYCVFGFDVMGADVK